MQPALFLFYKLVAVAAGVIAIGLALIAVLLLAAAVVGWVRRANT